MNNQAQQDQARNSHFAGCGDSSTTGFLPARKVLDRYGVSDMTIWRWLRDEKMNFPKPVYLGRFRYWRISEIEAWEIAQMRGAA